MSQNQSFFWHTTTRNVYLKRSAKLHMLLALMAVLTYATICCAEINGENNDDNGLPMGAVTVMREEQSLERDLELGNVALPNKDAVEKEKSSQSGFVDAFTASISVILFTELGDKTFFIAAIMAMRHPRLIVFSGAIMALALMTVLSVVFGMAAQIIPKVYTYYISTALFAIFGLKMIYDGYKMKPTDAQEELEEVQSDLRKREDELLRSKHSKSKYDENDTKRKNSNSDKEDGQRSNEDIESNSDNNNKKNAIGNGVTSASPVTRQNPEMEHRQRKQRSNQTSNNNSSVINNNTSNNNKSNNNNNSKANTNKADCDLANATMMMKTNASDTNDSGNECDESDVFLEKNANGSGGGGSVGAAGDAIKMSTFHSSPALSSIASTQTTQTHCDDYPNSPILSNGVATPTNKRRMNGGAAATVGTGAGSDANHHAGGTAMVHHSNSSGATLMLSDTTRKHSINSISGISVNSIGDAAAAGQQIGGSKNRLERNVSATTVQDPESGLVRKPPKRGAAYLTTRVFMQAFTMTFLAEWGDRSQLTTIILAASKNVYGVIAGGVIGHSICTGLAVIGGRMVAAKISVRTVTIVGGAVFLGFAFYALIVRPDDI